MDRPSLRYSDLSLDAIKNFHRQYGCVMVELSPSRGKLLLSLLEQRDHVERDLLTDVTFFQLVRHYIDWIFYENNARLFHKHLLTLQGYVSAVDAAHGWETNPEGNQVFVLLPLNKQRPNSATNSDTPTSCAPVS